MRWQRLPGILPHVGGSERVFWDLFGMQDASDAFWLDRWVHHPCPQGPSKHLRSVVCTLGINSATMPDFSGPLQSSGSPAWQPIAQEWTCMIADA